MSPKFPYFPPCPDCEALGGMAGPSKHRSDCPRVKTGIPMQIGPPWHPWHPWPNGSLVKNVIPLEAR